MVGPVAVDVHTLVDECRDLSLTAATEGQVSAAAENARTVQEDCHRLAIRPGSSVVYQVKEPIWRCSIYTFGPAEAALELSISKDGMTYRPAAIDRAAYPSSQTIYGYLTPVLYRGELPSDATYLKIALPEAAKSGVIEISRVEIEYGGAPARRRSTARPAAKAVQLNSSIFVDSTRPIDDTLKAVDAASRRGERQLNVVVTILVDLTDDLRIKSFGGFDRTTNEYKPMDEAMRKEIADELRRVFARMVEHDMAVYVLPHIDAGGKVRTWRNWVNFDPLEPYGGYTYADLMLGSIADALAETAKPDTRIEMALSGEMGRSLFRHPGSYRAVVRRLRARHDSKNLRLGISLNHGGIAGNNNPNGAQDPELSDELRKEMQSLINECDFVGMSFYAPVTTSPTPDDFVRGIHRFMGEFEQHGLRVPTTKPMHFSEVGIGGGRVRRGEAPSAAKAVEAPWDGTAVPRDNPWREETMQALRRQYHAALLEFLRKQPAPWRVSAAFFWSMGSWDPIGTRNPEFADSQINKAVQRHNAGAASAR
jgi:hypothetical protein